jgi:hypothetical protein
MIKILLVVFLLCFESICASIRKPKTSTKARVTPLNDSVVKYIRDEINCGELEQNYGIKFLRYYKILKKFDDLFSTEFVNNFGNYLKTNNLKLYFIDPFSKTEIHLGMESAVKKNMNSSSKRNPTALETLIQSATDSLNPIEGLPIMFSKFLILSESDQVKLLIGIFKCIKDRVYKEMSPENEELSNLEKIVESNLQQLNHDTDSVNLSLSLNLQGNNTIKELVSDVTRLFKSYTDDGRPIDNIEFICKLFSSKKLPLELKGNIDGTEQVIEFSIPETMKKEEERLKNVIKEESEKAELLKGQEQEQKQKEEAENQPETKIQQKILEEMNKEAENQPEIAEIQQKHHLEEMNKEAENQVLFIEETPSIIIIEPPKQVEKEETDKESKPTGKKQEIVYGLDNTGEIQEQNNDDAADDQIEEDDGHDSGNDQIGRNNPFNSKTETDSNSAHNSIISPTNIFTPNPKDQNENRKSAAADTSNIFTDPKLFKNTDQFMLKQSSVVNGGKNFTPGEVSSSELVTEFRSPFWPLLISFIVVGGIVLCTVAGYFIFVEKKGSQAVEL